jgi:hypothetical protein
VFGRFRKKENNLLSPRTKLKILGFPAHSLVRIPAATTQLVEGIVLNIFGVGGMRCDRGLFQVNLKAFSWQNRGRE